MIPTLKLPVNSSSPIFQGDTFSGVTFNIKKNGTAINLTGASASIEFKFKETTTTASLSVGNGITITDAVNGTIQIDEILNINWRQGTHVGFLKITDSNNRTLTYCRITVEIK